MEQVYINTAKVMKALSDPKRLKIVDLLSQGERCANNIQNSFNVSQPTLSHDMRVLKEAGVTLERRDGKNIFYTLNEDALSAFLRLLDTVFSVEGTYTSESENETE